MTIAMQSVTGDTQVRAIGYDLASQTLRVQFGSGAVYDYTGVPPEVREALMAAESVGGAFSQQIAGHYAGSLVLSPAENYESS